MRLRPVAVVAVLAAVVVSAPPAPPASAATATLFTLHDPRLAEVSGIARGRTSPGVYYVQNDSGDAAHFFALDARTGRVRAVYSVPGAENHDWEDIAVAPDARGVSSVWLADIGDNNGVRDDVQLYRVDEPAVDMTRSAVVARTGRPDVWRLQYPAGPVNAESLAVSPHGRAYVVSKAADGRSAVYAVPSDPASGRVQRLTRIGTITLRARASLVPARLQLLATGAALSADGSLLVVRTYTDAYVWPVHGGKVGAALGTVPRRLSLPLQPQGEGVCIVGAYLVVDSEQVGSAVYRVPLQRPDGRSTQPAPVPAPSTAAAPTPATSSSSAGSADRGIPLAVLAGLVAAGLLALAALAVRRHRARG